MTIKRAMIDELYTTREAQNRERERERTRLAEIRSSALPANDPQAVASQALDDATARAAVDGLNDELKRLDSVIDLYWETHGES